MFLDFFGIDSLSERNKGSFYGDIKKIVARIDESLRKL